MPKRDPGPDETATGGDRNRTARAWKSHGRAGGRGCGWRGQADGRDGQNDAWPVRRVAWKMRSGGVGMPVVGSDGSSSGEIRDDGWKAVIFGGGVESGKAGLDLEPGEAVSGGKKSVSGT
jgi:hypothetical protein